MKNWTKMIVRSLLCLLAASAAFASCASDDALWDKIYDLEARLDSLENNLNNQVEALNALMSDGSTISSCVQNADGSYAIELSDGTRFTAMPDSTDFSSLVSCTLVNGKNCWATYDAAGNLVPLTDPSGKPVPVSTTIQVKIVDGKYYLVAGGNEYVTGYDTEDLVQVFNSCVAHKDASGNIYAMTFDFGSGMKVTVAVDGYKGVIFKSTGEKEELLSGYYIDYGQTQTVLMDTHGVVDYVMQIPDGWRVVEKVQQTGNILVSITAPAIETVNMGAAVSSGDLKVVSVVEGGKAAVTRLSLSTDPFKTYDVSVMRASVEVYQGVSGFVYGISPADGFDQNQLMTKLNEVLNADTLPEGYNLSKTGIDKSHEEIHGALEDGVPYVFWAVPVFGSEDDPETGLYASQDMLRLFFMFPMTANVEIGKSTLLDAPVKLKVSGTAKMYGGVALKTEDTIGEIVAQINLGAIDPLTDPALFTYEGPASEFPDKEYPLYMEPDTSYVVWVLPVEDGKTEFKVSDVVYKEFKTLDIKPGGSLKATVGTPAATSSSITHKVTCEEAAMIYYAYLNDAEGSDNAEFGFSTKWDLIHNEKVRVKYDAVRGSSIDAEVDGLMPETTMWLYAVPVGHDGLCGEFVSMSAKTSAVTFNSLKVTVTESEVLSDEATFNVSVSNGTPTDYIFWVGRKSDEFWIRCKSSRLTAEKYLAANPDCMEVQEAMKKGKIEPDGTLRLTGLAIAKEHVLLVLAHDGNGNYSRAGYKLFTTKSINLGADFVAEGSDKWNTTKEWIEKNIVWDEDYFEPAAGSGQGSAAYAFDIKIPTDLTAFVYCFGVKDDITEMIDQIVYVEGECSRSASYAKVVQDENGNQPLLPDWYDDNGKLIQGTLLSISNFFVHGDPSRGFVTYFADGGHDDHCQVWSDGACQSYVNYQETIAKYMTVDYWKNYLIGFGNYTDPTTGEVIRLLKDEAKIQKIAQEYCDLYTKYYKDVEPIVYINKGEALRVTNRNATGLDSTGTEVVDKITIVLKDLNGNYYAPMVIDVPNYFN